MLKSHFNLAQKERVEEHLPEVEGEGETTTEVAPEEEERPIYPERILKRSEVCPRLSVLGKTAAGDGYTYLKANISGMNLTEIKAILCFKHLQFLDVSNNNLDLDALQVVTELPSLVLLHADKNDLHSAALKRMKYMQVLIFNYNKLTAVDDVFQPELCTLEAGYNKIRRVFFINRMPTLKVLDFRYNVIEDIIEFDFPNLDSLYLAGNKIKYLTGLERLPYLRILHVRNNPIRLLNGFDEGLKKLQYINLRNCKVSTLIQVKKLRVLPALETLIMKGCPYMGGTGEEGPENTQEEEDAETRVEMLAALPKLKRINKAIITPEERMEAKDLMMQWLEEGEKDEEEMLEEHNIEEESNVED